MRQRIRAISFAMFLSIAMAAAPGCRGHEHGKGMGTASQLAPRPAEINHIVFFKLKDHADAATLIAECDAELRRLPMVAAYACGTHLDTGRGARVDSDYDVGLYIGFASEADYAAYVQHPVHAALVTKWRPRWEWIRVYDVRDSSP